MDNRLRYILKWAVICLLVGLLAGSASAAFLASLAAVTEWREHHDWLLWLLPVAGLVIGWAYLKFGRSVERGTDLLLDEVHAPKAQIPLRMVPLIWLSTLVTHLFGGSAGREGTAVQLGGTIADGLCKPFRLSGSERKILLMAGMSAGFGSVFGVPFAGAVFGLEVLSIGKVKMRAVGECLLASLVAHWTCLAWGIHHTAYPRVEAVALSLTSCLWIIPAGILFGLCARAFALLVHRFGEFMRDRISYLPYRLASGGALVAIGYWWLGSTQYAGLGISTIEQSLRTPLAPLTWAWKILFTVLTLGSGFKGGEVTPLLFIGSTLGNSLAPLISLPLPVLAAVGLVAVFAGAANTPWACTLMAIELFGPPIGIFALIGCWCSYLVSGAPGIYHSQRR